MVCWLELLNDGVYYGYGFNAVTFCLILILGVVVLYSVVCTFGVYVVLSSG